MDNIKAFRRQIVGLFCIVFFISTTITYFIFSFLNLFNDTTISKKYVVVYNILLIVSSITLLHIFIKYLFEKLKVQNENLWIFRFLNHNREIEVLSGFYTKFGLKNKVNDFLKSEPNKVGCMLYLDIDNIKFINDKYGHDVGDEFILKLSEILKYFEKYNGSVSHISSDEFVVYLHGFENEEKLFEICKEFYMFSEKFNIVTPDGVINKVRFSSGIAFYPNDAQNFDDLYKFSDFALYSAKNNEKGFITKFNITEYKNNFHILENTLAINQLLDSELVKFAYQPIVDLKTGEIYAYEALMRSTMENFKSPTEIIDVATIQSKLQQLEKLVVFSVYEDFRKNEDVLGNCKIFLNSLPSQVLDLESAFELVKRYEKYLGRIVIEITEQASLNIENLERKLQFARDYNLQIAIDDFGSGFSNERRILGLNPDIVKIDMSLIQGIHNDNDKKTIVCNLVDFCHGKNIRVVAEGVETSLDLEYISKIGIDYVQGYYVGKPSFEILSISEEVKKEIVSYNKQS